MWTQADKHFLIEQLVWQQLLNYLKYIFAIRQVFSSNLLLNTFTCSVEEVFKQCESSSLLNSNYYLRRSILSEVKWFGDVKAVGADSFGLIFGSD